MKKLLVICLLLISVSVATSQTDPETFLRCLVKEGSNPQVFISDVTYIPSNSSFTTILRRRIPNLRFDKPTTPKPIAIITPTTWSHVSPALACARLLPVQVRIRSGGHDFEGLSYTSTAPFFLIDMFNFNSVDVNLTEGTAWVDTGATLGELYYKIAEKSNVLGFPAGLCTTLGVGGHISGGGYGTMMRKYGLAVDNVVGSRIIDSNGNTYFDRMSMGEELFWAVRGGGAASFGIVMGYKIRLVPVPEKVTVFSVGRTVGEGAVDLIMKWQNFSHTTDRSLFVRLTLTLVNGTKPGEKMVLATFIGMYLGPLDKTLNVMNRDFPELKLKKTDCTEMRWIDSILFWAGYPIGTPTSVLLKTTTVSNKAFHKRKSDYVKRTISRTDLGLIFKKLVEVEKVKMFLNPYGGRMGEIPSSRTPFPHRGGNLFKIEYLISWSQAGDDAEKNHLAKANEMYKFMTPYVSSNPREAYFNYRDLDLGTSLNSTYEEGKIYGAKYFKDNFERLVDIKTKYDEINFWRNEQSIPVRK
ncbi:PREDICTED: reticuline oxidase-like protein [Camelina sativa]|uniref:Reticuline oxidase-like protein n=1 Tax=Camelina sativa TaxID=90675 RepID=A0ABM0YIZ9_CAMSA|nr:PREDICTED: reticuline oxidase-like protein [Camelina sativa]